MTKTAEDFKQKVKEKGITKWFIHSCSFCNYPCGFLFKQDGTAWYDAGCDCSRQPPSPSNFDEVAELYNMQSNPEFIQTMDEFWGFNKEKPVSPDKRISGKEKV